MNIEVNRRRRRVRLSALTLALAACLTLPNVASAQSGETLDLTDAQMEDLVRRSY
jgi:hypothetical protein